MTENLSKLKEQAKSLNKITERFDLNGQDRNFITIFGASRIKRNTKHYKLAEEIAFDLSEKGFSIITGAGAGIMEAANKGAEKGKGLSVGLNTPIPKDEFINSFLEVEIKIDTLFVRKILFFGHAKAFLFFPGGIGTLDELFEILTLIQIEKVAPLPIILIHKNFWDGLIDWMKEKMLREEKTIDENIFGYLSFAENTEEVLLLLKQS